MKYAGPEGSQAPFKGLGSRGGSCPGHLSKYVHIYIYIYLYLNIYIYILICMGTYMYM